MNKENKNIKELTIQDLTIKGQMRQLVDELLEHNERYYNQNNPIISDKEYDMLYKRLEALEAKHPDLILPDSPTRQVGASTEESTDTVVHSIPMLSLQNSYNREEVEKFLDKVGKLGTFSLSVEPKMDGAAVSITYTDGKLKLAATRGDGITGELITDNVKTIRSLPVKIDYKDTLVVRGEIFMPKDSFNKLNAERAESGQAPFANPRNAASGSLKLLDSKEAAHRALDIYIYNIDSDTGNTTHEQDLNLLQNLGFPINRLNAICKGDAVFTQLDLIESKRFSLPYDIDGAVIKVNEYSVREKAGSTGKFPKWAIAYKYEALQATTVLKDVTFQVGRTGAVTPVAELEPVLLSGSTISRATLHNEDEIIRLGVKIGDTVFIEKGGEIIPKVVKVVEDKRTADAKDIIFPELCPICGTKLVKPDGEVRWRCPNLICPARVKGALIHFAGKDAMFIDGLGETLINALVDERRLKTFRDIYTLTEDELAVRERMGKRSAEKIVKAVNESKKREFYRVLFALGLPQVGISTARSLAAEFGSMDKLMSVTYEELLSIKDIGDKTAEMLVSSFKNPDFIQIINELKEQGLVFKQEAKVTVTDTKISGKTFLITGTLSKSRKAVEDDILAKGGVISGSVSKNLNYLVVGEKAGSKLAKATSLGVSTLTENELYDLLG